MVNKTLIGSYPAIGIRPVIDGRTGPMKLRDSLEDQTMALAEAAKALFVQGAHSEDIPTTAYPADVFEKGIDLITMLVDSKLAPTRSEGRRLILGGGVVVNGEKETDFAKTYTPSDFNENGVILIKKGKKGYHQFKAE